MHKESRWRAEGEQSKSRERAEREQRTDREQIKSREREREKKREQRESRSPLLIISPSDDDNDVSLAHHIYDHFDPD